jgi:predicted RNA-binding Zn-ribbon protein involved in translation (DUF1610 family)
LVSEGASANPALRLSSTVRPRWLPISLSRQRFERALHLMTSTTEHKSGCLAAILRLLTGKTQTTTSSSDSLPYRVRDDFLSPAENSFFHVLCSVVGEQVVICPKVRLADIFFVVRPDKNLAYFNRISQRHVDFLLCERGSMKPILCVELDDSSHSRSGRKARDEFVDKAFEAADLPLLHIAAQRSYDTRELTGKVAQFLGDATRSPVSPGAIATPELMQTPTAKAVGRVPLCPKCGVPMVVRTATRGKRKGEQFYGCPNYPRCREVQPLER